MLWAIAMALLVLVGITFRLYGSARKRQRRQTYALRPFPEEWDNILRETLPVYVLIPSPFREELQTLINVFVAEKRFEGCGGLEITDEIRVSIATQACLLLLNRGVTEPYPNLTSILVYPAAYKAQAYTISHGSVATGEQVRLGESWTRGAVVLAWDSVRRGAANFHDGHNVVLHEFAHQLDQEDGRGDGAPVLEKRSSYITWARVLGHEFKDLQQRIEHHQRTVLDAYGATEPAEFFAVATETFFEKPMALMRKHPDLYAELASFYRVDPGKWDKE